MKRITAVMLIGMVIFKAMPSNAQACEAEHGEYIVKIAENRGRGIIRDAVALGDGLYLCSDLENMEKNYDVEYSYPNYSAELFGEYPNTLSDEYVGEQWYLEAIGASAARKKGINGKNVRIAVIDSGIYENHPDFEGIDIEKGCNCIEGAKDTEDFSDNYGHGTMVAGVISAAADNAAGIAGIADGVSIIPIKITEGKSLTFADICLGFDKALELDCDIINMSFGGTFGNDPNAISDLYKKIKKAEAAGICVIAAAGNGGTKIYYPAGYEEVIGVGALSSDGAVFKYSQVNSSVFLIAPGDSILSLSNDGKTATDSGTSYSAPIVSAAVALIKEIDPSITPSEVRTLLKQTAVPLSAAEYDESYGWGKLSISGIIDELEEKIPECAVLRGGGAGRKKLYVYNNTESDLSAWIYFAKYDFKGDFCGLSSNPITALPGVGECDIPDGYGTAFIWNEKMSPYTEKYEIK